MAEHKTERDEVRAVLVALNEMKAETERVQQWFKPLTRYLDIVPALSARLEPLLSSVDDNLKAVEAELESARTQAESQKAAFQQDMQRLAAEKADYERQTREAREAAGAAVREKKIAEASYTEQLRSLTAQTEQAKAAHEQSLASMESAHKAAVAQYQGELADLQAAIQQAREQLDALRESGLKALNALR